MSAQDLGSRAIIGEYVRMLEQDNGVGWVNQISNLFQSDQLSETYKFLGQSPVFRERKGERKAKGLRDEGFTIRNIDFESTMDIEKAQLRRDKTGQMLARIGEHVQRSSSHWATLLSTLIVNGETNTCYDGQFFFDEDHVWGDSGSQSNDISVDISALPVTTNGSVTAPSPEEAAQAAMQGVTQICGFLDDQGEPMNETASQFLILCPFSLENSLKSGLALPRGTDAAEQVTEKRIQVVGNARLNSSWTDKFVVFRTDSPIKSLIRQEEVGVNVSALAEGSDYAFTNDAYQFGLDATRNAGYGYWEHACLVTMT